MQIKYDFMFLSKGELPFLLSSLKNFMDGKHYETAKSDIGINSLKELDDLPSIFIVDAAVLHENPESKAFLVDLCIQQNIKIALIGENEAIEAVSSTALSNIIIATFIRPINNNEVADKLEDLIAAIREKNNQKRILVIDDSPTFLRLANEWLQEDYIINICPSATAAFVMIENNKPDLILLDYEMPVCNGARFLEMLHSESIYEDIPVIFLTSKDDANTVREVLSLKPQGYLLKNQPKELIVSSIANFFTKGSCQ